MKNKSLEIFDKVFNTHNITTDSLLVDIILDRKYNIPDWLYKYISDDVLVTIILNSKDTKEFREFIKIINTRCKFNDKYLAMVMLQSDIMMQYAFIISPKKFYNYIIGSSENVSSTYIIQLIRKYIEYHGDVAPKEYYYLLSYSLIVPSDVGRKINFKRLFSSQIYKLYSPILVNLKTCGDMYFFNMFFKGLYITYQNILTNEYNNDPTFSMIDNPYDLIKFYWEMGGRYIPSNFNLDNCKVYIDIVKKSKQTMAFSNDLVPILERYKNDLPEDMKSFFIDTLKTNIYNVKLLVWNLTEKERIYVKKTYYSYHKPNIKSMDFSKYVSIVYGDSLVPFVECEKFMQNGGNVDIEKIAIDDIDDFIDCIMKYMPDRELIQYLSDDVKINFFNRRISLLEHIADSYIKYNRGTNILNRFYSIIFDNTEIIDLMLNKLYITYPQLISKSSLSEIDIISKHPKMIKYQDNLPATIICSIINSNPDVIEYIPWRYLSEHHILNRISSNGYFPIMVDGDEPIDILRYAPMKYVNTEKLINLMKSGKGLGYCLDYSLPEYVESILTILVNLYNK